MEKLIRLWYRILEFRPKRTIKYFFQRRLRGWDDSDTWSIPYTTAKLLLPRMKRFKILANGYPMDMTVEEWYVILDKIILAFQICVEDDAGTYKEDRLQKYEEGIELFHKYYEAIWW